MPKKKASLAKRLIRALWVLQPRCVRRAELELVDRFLSRPLSPTRPLDRGDVVICGFLGTASGLGQGARHMLDLFRQKGLPVRGANASHFAVLDDFDAGPLWPEKATEGGIAIFHINPDVFSLVWNAIGAQKLKKRRIVGVWAWELAKVPEKWKRAAGLVDEIWAPSRFVADAIRAVAPDKTIHILPYPLDVSVYRQAMTKDPLPMFAGKTVVFFSYDVRSLHARKNPEAVIEAFRRASINNPHAALLIKINNNEAWPEAGLRVLQATEGLPHVHIMHDKLSDSAMLDLYARVDVVMSLHRSEGFGLLMASAMAAGKPVIATGWSGNMDFMTPESSILVDYKLIPIEDPQHVYDRYNATWADPDIDQAAAALNKLLNDPEERQRLGMAARKQAEHFFSQENWIKSLPPRFWDSINS